MKKASLVTVLLAVGMALSWGQAVDLTMPDLYIRKGFALEWTFHAPYPGDTGWIRVPSAPGSRPVVIRDIFAEDNPKAGAKPERYCAVLPFYADERLLASSGGIGLYLGRIGQNWQVYLNGYLLRDETYFQPDDRLSVHRSARGVLIEVDPSRMKPGGNVLAFMIAGDPGDRFTGLTAPAPYLIASYEELSSLNAEIPRLMLIGIFFFFALYHGVLYALRPKNKAYLYYGLGTMLLSLYLFSRTFIVYEILLDTRAIDALGTAALFLLIPSFMAFFDASLGRRVSVFAKTYALLCAAASVAQAFAWREALTTAWRFTVLAPLAYILVLDLLLPISASVREHLGQRRGKGGALRALVRGVFRSDASKLILGTAVLSATVLLDASEALPGVGVSLTDAAFLVLVFGTAAVLARQFIRVYREAEEVKLDLERRVAARSEELRAELAVQESLSVRLSEASSRYQAAASIAEKDLMIATQVQQGFFPKSAPRTSEWDVAFSFMPAGGLSGDLYDFYMGAGRLDGLVIGDVSGQGIASGLITVLARSIFHRNFYERRHRSLGAVLEAINEELIPELSDVENFITAALLRFEDGGKVEFASAAHTDMLYRGAGKLRASAIRPRGDQDYKGPPLGREGIELPYTSVKITVMPGDAILVHTDGMNEAKNVDGEAFGEEGVLAALSSAPAGEASLMLDFIMQEWRFHVSGSRVADDVTAILLKKL